MTGNEGHRHLLELVVNNIPLPPLEVSRLPIPSAFSWRSVPSAAFLPDWRALGLRPGPAFMGREAFPTMPLMFVLIVTAGYIGSFIVLVPGAQTYDTLKDLVVYSGIALFGYPATDTQFRSHMDCRT